MYLTIKQLSQNVKDNAIFKIILYNKIGEENAFRIFYKWNVTKTRLGNDKYLFYKRKKKEKKVNYWYIDKI